MSNASVTVAICTRERPEMLRRCLAGVVVAAAETDAVVDILVVDNAPTSDATAQVVAEVAGVRHVVEPVAGLDVARNAALREAVGEIVAFTDDDAVVDRGWLTAIVEVFDQCQDAVIVTGPVLPLRLDTEAQLVFERNGGFGGGSARVSRPLGIPATNWLEASDCGAGCNMAVRRSRAVATGGFDENLDTGAALPGGGDLDFFARALARRDRVEYAPSVVVHHEHRRSMAELRRQYRSWGRSWMAGALRSSRSGGPGLPSGVRQACYWWRTKVGGLLRGSAEERLMILHEMAGAVPGMCGEYGRSRRRMARRRVQHGGPTVAFLPWGHVIEDYLDDIGLGLDEFLDAQEGGWLFGMLDAVRRAGGRSVLLLVASTPSARRRIHRPTGTPVVVLPAGRLSTRLHSVVRHRYEVEWGHAVAVHRLRWKRIAAGLAWILLPWVSTPPIKLRRALRSAGVDVLVCQEYEEVRFDICVALRRFLGVQVWGIFQGGSQTRSVDRWHRSRVVRAADGVIVADAREAGRVAATHGRPISTIDRIPNPVAVPSAATIPARSDARRLLCMADDDAVALWYGRIERERKGLDVLIDAWELVRAGVADARTYRLVLVGDGVDAPWLRERLRNGPDGVSWEARFVQDRQYLLTRLAAADVFVLPSRHEGFAVAPMEAMAAGLPVVATKVPGVDELVAEGTGLVVPIGDVDELAAALGRLLADPRRATDLGAAARARILARYGPSEVGSQLLAAIGVGTRG